MCEIKKLSDNWTFYIHLQENKDWSIDSYIKIMNFNNVEEAILLNDEINYDLIKKSMLFLMKEDIFPTWEHEKNRDGGCFSFKVFNKDVAFVWKQLYYCLIGNSLTADIEANKCINGITVSPKKKFCIVKVWMNGCQYNDTKIFTKIDGLDIDGCIFKKHVPEC